MDDKSDLRDLLHAEEHLENAKNSDSLDEAMPHILLAHGIIMKHRQDRMKHEKTD